MIIAGGLCGLAIWLVSAWSLRRVWRREAAALPSRSGAELAWDGRSGEHSPDLVGR
jgi:hypothetical protein